MAIEPIIIEADGVETKNFIEFRDVHGALVSYIDSTGTGQGALNDNVLNALRQANYGSVSNTLPDLTQLVVPDAGGALTIPTGYASPDLVEPSVLYDVEAPFLGYEYVLCAAPYYQVNAALENPCLWVSHDGNTWYPIKFTDGIGVVDTAYAGAYTVTPVFPQGVQGDGNNSDPFLCRGPAGEYYLVWNQFLNAAPSGTGTGGNDWSTKVSTAASLAGPWSTPVTVVAEKHLTETRFSCPSAFHDGTQWHIYGVDLKDVTIQPPIVHYTCSDNSLQGEWVKQSNPSISVPAAYSTRGWWHLNAYRLGSRHVLFIQDNVINTSSAGYLWVVWSDDGGTTWNVPSAPFLASGSWYRPSAVFTNRGRSLGVDLFPGYYTGSVFEMWRTSASLEPLLYGGLGADGIPQEAKTLAAARVPVAPYVFGDTCKRTDSAVSPGTADSGLVYTVANGTVGISSNALYGVGASNDKAVVNTGISDGVFTAEFSVIDRSVGQMYLMLRYVDGNNFLRFGFQINGGYRLDDVVSAAVTQSVTTAIVPANGDWITAVLNGEDIAIYLNGITIISASWADNQAGTSMGPQFSVPSNNRMRNLSARPLINGA
jgi:hypothetical protein